MNVDADYKFILNWFDDIEFRIVDLSLYYEDALRQYMKTRDGFGLDPLGHVALPNIGWKDL
jgi:hypothetical protein